MENRSRRTDLETPHLQLIGDKILRLLGDLLHEIELFFEHLVDHGLFVDPFAHQHFCSDEIDKSVVNATSFLSPSGRGKYAFDDGSLRNRLGETVRCEMEYAAGASLISGFADAVAVVNKPGLLRRKNAIASEVHLKVLIAWHSEPEHSS